jgi:hypothetical protein
MRRMRMSILVVLGMSGILSEADMWWLDARSTVDPRNCATVRLNSLVETHGAEDEQYLVASLKKRGLQCMGCRSRCYEKP